MPRRCPVLIAVRDHPDIGVQAVKKAKEHLGPELWPVYLRMAPDLVAWVDKQAKRQRRSRAYVIGQAVRMMRAFVEQVEQEQGPVR